ncbi:hypothetical protein Rhopal_003628-T1 [Rhodotorula paludigena]|uniref:Transcription factor TFIIIC complex subunit Tfc6 n=1 Tax=Rhodotorula paludigena TaxID=86838 RepID=A0AAV5GDK3_9BASI|nr:hypothetical protein Rhopal_003628-T1 [Rhodotorula paludigena]
MPPRPRRSAASTSYAHLLQPLQLSSSGSSSDSDTPAQAADGAPKPKKRKRKPVYIPEDSSGSEFELPDKQDGKGSGADAAASDDDDDDDDDSAALDDDDDDLGSGGSVSGASGLSGSIVGGSPGPGRGGRGRGRGGRRGGGRTGGRGITAATEPQHAVVVTAGATATRKGDAGALPPRATVPVKHPYTALGSQHSYVGPLASMAPARRLADAGGKGKARSFAAGEAADPLVLTDDQVHGLLETWTGSPFGVEKDEVWDFGWLPRRYEREGDSIRERPRWGGWYDEVKVPEIGTVPESDRTAYLPTQVYSNRPAPLFAPSVPLAGSNGEAPAGADSAADSSAPGTPGPLADELPVPPPEFGAAVAGPSDTQMQDSAASTSGSVRLRVGKVLAKGVDTGEEVLELARFETKRLDEVVHRKPGHIFNAGGPISSVKWAPRPDGPADKEYVLVATSSDPEAPLRHVPSSSSSSPSRSALQLWSVPASSATDFSPRTAEDAQDRMRLETVLCLPDGMGDARSVEWCPMGGTGKPSGEDASAKPDKDKGKGKGKGKGKQKEDAMDVDGDEDTATDARDKLGIVAAAFADGSVGIFVVPRPEDARERAGVAADSEEPAYITISPALRLRLPDTTCFSVAWGSHEVLAVGCMNGYIAVWRVGAALRAGKAPERPLRPTHYYPTHAGLIRALVFVATPPPSLLDREQHDFDAPPTGLLSAGYDGSTILSDLRDPSGNCTVLAHDRGPFCTVDFSPATGLAYSHDQEDRAKGFGLKPTYLGNESRISVHRGHIWSVACSTHHPFVLSTSSDGSAMFTSGIRSMRKRRVRGHFCHKLFRLEYERETGEVRMWDNLDVEFRQALDPGNPYGKSKPAAAISSATETSTSAWPLEQAVTAGAWHPALNRAPLCATGTALGIGRVDWTEGTVAFGKAK